MENELRTMIEKGTIADIDREYLSGDGEKRMYCDPDEAPIYQEFGIQVEDEDYDPEIDKTDVLTVDDVGLSSEDIYGTYNPEMTAVLRSDMAPGENSVERKVVGLDRPEITVIYCETVVHTEESL